VSLEIEIVHEATEELLIAMHHLVPQLSSSAVELTFDELAEIVACQTITLFAARDDGTIRGTLTLAVFRIPSGLRAWIEDVIVDENARGSGAGEALTTAAIERSRALGARSIDLTSRPSRESANRLYLRLGFAQRETNVFRFLLED
jgi:ribosomal protein S18 acetylase RimI-like enzyme